MKPVRLLLLVLLTLCLIGTLGIAQTSLVKMNEIYSRGVPTAPDWIEIYNGSTTQLDISGYKIYDSGGQAGTKPKMALPTGSVIPAKSFLVVVTDISTSVDPSGFGLSSGGETVWLENTAGALIDSITFTAMDTTQTYGRMPDGGGWKLLNTISRGSSNSLVLMNEIYSRGVPTDPDWIELHNSTSSQIDISGYKIYDSGGQAGTKPKMTFATGTVIPAKGFFVVVTDISTSVDPSGFGLSSGGETVWLEDKAGAIIDSVTFAAMDTVQSYSRVPDGRVWQLVNKRTRGASNGTSTAVQDQSPIAAEYALLQNYPNPFNPSTTITFALPRQEQVQLTVYNAVGQRVRTLINSQRPAGSQTVVWDGRDNQGREVASGVYFYELMAGTFSKSAKMLLVR
jgi:hypothetical protein